jgi:hypothetical protein
VELLEDDDAGKFDGDDEGNDDGWDWGEGNEEE